MASRLRALSTVVFVILAAWGGHRANLRLEELTVREKARGDLGPLPDGRVVRVASLGFERLLADLFWIRTAGYVGSSAAAEARYPAAARLAELVTDVDPYFDTAYVLMAGVVADLASDPDAAIALLEKGALHSDYWRIEFLLGFYYFMARDDYPQAARHMQRASQRGGPPYLPLLASRLYAQSGDPETAMALDAARLREGALHPEIRASLEQRFRNLWIMRDLGQIDAAIARHREQRGEEPTSVEALVRSGALERWPRDPEGGAYRIEKGRARCDLEWEPVGLRG